MAALATESIASSVSGGESSENEQLVFEFSRVASLSVPHVSWTDGSPTGEPQDAPQIHATWAFDVPAFGGSDDHDEQQQLKEEKQQEEQDEQGEEKQQEQEDAELLQAPSVSTHHRTLMEDVPDDRFQPGSRRHRARRRVRRLVRTMCCIS